MFQLFSFYECNVILKSHWHCMRGPLFNIKGKNMKLLKVTLAATTITAFAMSAQAQDSGLYGGLGIQTFEFDTVGLVGRAGYKISPNFGFEVEGAVGVSGNTEDEIETTTPWSAGGYVVTSYPVTENFELIGRLGYANINVEAEGFGQTEDVNLDGLATGGGIQYNFSDNNAIRFDYTSVNTSSGNADVLDVTFVRSF